MDYFPPNTHPLILVSDPDGLLADEVALSALTQRGFQIVLVITNGVLEDLPYDLWQRGRHIIHALHEFFPDLAYPVVHMLTATQRARASAGINFRSVLSTIRCSP